MSLPTDPVAICEEGKRVYQEGEYQKAAEIFLIAAEGYRQAGNASDAAEMDNNRSVALLQAGQAEAALQAVVGTVEIFAAAGDHRRQAMALGNRAAALSKLNRLPEAIADYQQAADLFKQIGEHELRAPVLQALSMLQLRSGRQVESLVTMNAGLNEFEKPKPRQRFLKKLLDLPLKIFFRS